MREDFPMTVDQDELRSSGAHPIESLSETKLHETQGESGSGFPPAWADLPQLMPNVTRMARSRIVTAYRADPRHIEIDMLRTRLLTRVREFNWGTLAVTSPRGGCGKTTLALNLAFSFAQLPFLRIGLVDLDLRRPKIARLLKCETESDIEPFLRGHKGLADSAVRLRQNLAVVPNSVRVSQPAELLVECVNGGSIEMLRQALGLDLLIFDLPPMLAADDALAVMPAVDGMLLVAAAGRTTLDDIDICHRELLQHDKFAGLVLNRCQYLPERFGY